MKQTHETIIKTLSEAGIVKVKRKQKCFELNHKTRTACWDETMKHLYEHQTLTVIHNT